MENHTEAPVVDHRVVLQQNIEWHRTEAYYYAATHPQAFNVLEQRHLKQQMHELARDADPAWPVLDLASGTGNLAGHLEKLNVNVVASDLSSDMLAENTSRHRVRCDISRLPFRDGCFGAVTAYAVLHHLPDPTATMSEISRVAAEACILYFDHDRFLQASRRTLGSYPFTVTDLVGWVLWLVINPRHLKRLFQYALSGRKRHLANARGLDQVESHDRVEPAKLVRVLEKRGFRVRLVPRSGGGGSFLKAARTLNAAREFEPPAEASG